MVDANRGEWVTVTALFFLAWGFLVSWNELLLPHLMTNFDLSRAQATIVRVAFFVSCFVFALPAARLVHRIGYHWTLVSGILGVGAGAFTCVLAAMCSSATLFMAAVLVATAGMAILVLAANLYVARLGTAETAASRLTFAQGCFSAGSAIAMVAGTLVIFSAVPMTSAELRSLSPEALHYYRIAQVASVKTPYLMLGVLAVIVAALIGSSRLPAVADTSAKSESSRSRVHLILGCIAMFLAIGVTASISIMLPGYLSQIGHMSSNAAKRITWFYFAGAIAGPFIAAALLRKITTAALLAICACGGGVLLIVSALSNGQIAISSLLAIGFFVTVMFPAIFAMSVAEPSSCTSNSAVAITMSMVGGAVVPALLRALAEHVGTQHALLLLAGCCAYILLFALRGYKTTHARRQLRFSASLEHWNR